MKILQVINSLNSGGAEKLLLDTIPLYRKQGLTMDILILWDNDFGFVQKLRQLDCCTIHILKKSGNYKHIYHPSHILKIAKVMRGYQVAHVHLFPAQYYTVLANLLIGSTCKLVMTEHNVTNNRIHKAIYKPIERFIYNRYSRVICISDEIKEIYASYLKNLDNKLVVIENGVAIKNIQEATRYERDKIALGILNGDRVLLQVSAFRKQKDQKTLIKSVQFLPDNVKLLLVGEGVYRKECEDFVNELGLVSRVFFLGARMDVPRLLKSADIVVLSSHNEGMSLSSIEGMASGKPFVASDVPGLTNIVQGAGVLFKLGNAQELAQVIQRLLDDKAHYDAVVKTCLERAAQYDIQVMVDKTMALYKELLPTTQA